MGETDDALLAEALRAFITGNGLDPYYSLNEPFAEQPPWTFTLDGTVDLRPEVAAAVERTIAAAQP